MIPAELRDVPEVRELTSIVIAEKTVLQPKAVTVVPVKRLEGDWLMEPLPKWAGTQAVPAVYRDLQQIAVMNLTERAVTWRAGLIVGTVAPMDASQDIPQRRIEALRTIRHARGESMMDPSLDQLYYTWSWRRTAF